MSDNQRLIRKHRLIGTFSQKRLRRARKLYIWLVHSHFIKNPNLVWVFAQRAQKRGLYADKTSLKDACFSIVRGVYKIFRNYYGYRKCWSSFMQEYNCALIWFSMGRCKKMKYGKPVLRIRA